MNFGFDTTWIDFSKWIGRYIVKIHIPNIKIGFIQDKFECEKWVGIKAEFTTDIHFESYDYGFVFSFVLLGLGISINRMS